MPRALLIQAFLFCCLPMSAAGQGIYRCSGTGGTVYQDTPCAAGQSSTPLTMARGTTLTQRDAHPTLGAQCTSRTGGRAALPFRPMVLCLGMSDDEVLNLPRWGRPVRITRTKANRTWQEQWEYGSPATSTARRLHFVNGRLTTIEADVDARGAIAAP